MDTDNIYEAKTQLSKSHNQTAKPLGEVAALDTPTTSNRLGFMEGQAPIPDDFNEMGQDEILRLFEGESA